MKLKLNLLFVFLMTMTIRAQNVKEMNATNDSITKGIVISKGKLVYSEIVIKASPEKVWQEFVDFENYSTWNPFIKSLKGSPIKGNKIEVFLQSPGKKGMLFKPKVLIFEHSHQFR